MTYSNLSCSRFCLKLQNPKILPQKTVHHFWEKGLLYTGFVPYTSVRTKVLFLIAVDTSVCFVAPDINKLELEYAVTWLLGAALTALCGNILSTLTGVESSPEVRNYRAHQIKLEK